MPSIKKDSFGKLSDGREATIYTLRNIKGNELKITNYGARIVSMRFRNKDFQNKFVIQGKENVGGYENSNDILWQAEEITEGLKLTSAQGEIIYSLSNDNEISVKYEGVPAQIIFNSEVLADARFRIYDDAKTQGKIAGQNTYSIIDKPAEVLMEVGMFGYDPGCPIDWLNSGLKNAADIVSDAANIELNIFITQNNFQIAEVEGGFAITTSGETKSQAVYVLKNRN